MNDFKKAINKAGHYRTFYEVAKKLTDPKDRLAFYDALDAYRFDGIEPAGLSPLVELVWIAIRPNVDADIQNKLTGASGGRGRKNSDVKPPIEKTEKPVTEKTESGEEESKKPPFSDLKNPPFEKMKTDEDVDEDVDVEEDADADGAIRVEDVEAWFEKKGITLASQDLKKITTSLIIKQKPLLYLDYAFNYIRKKSYKARDGTLTSFNELPEANQRGMFLTAVSTWQDMEAGFAEWLKDYKPKAPDTCPKCGLKIQNRGGILCCTSCYGEVCFKDGRWILEPWMTGGSLRVEKMGNGPDG